MKTPSPAALEAALVRGPSEGLCLDFVNTRSWRGTASPSEELQAPSDLLLWVERIGVVDATTLRRARADWEAAPGRADAALAAALALREALFRVFAATTAGATPAVGDLEVVNAALHEAPKRTHLRLGSDGGVWELPFLPPDAAVLLAPVLWSAGDLLAGSRLPRVRQCANPKCRWLFVDDSKSGTRRWCSMASCGNRAKAHRHYAKRRQPKHSA